MDSIEIDGSHNFLRHSPDDNGDKGDTTMRNEQALRDAIHARAIAARERNGGTGRLADVEAEHGEPECTGWRRYFKWECLTMSTGRTIEKGWVVPQPLGIALLLVILGGVGSLYWRITDKQVETEKAATARYMEQREMMIRLDQRFIDKEVHDSGERKEIKDRQELHALQIQDLKDKLLVASIK